ncbi:hypothetical protein THAOC_23643, partial [Thalassiosira oceanica]
FAYRLPIGPTGAASLIFRWLRRGGQNVLCKGLISETEASASHAVFVGRGRAPILQRSWEGWPKIPSTSPVLPDRSESKRGRTTNGHTGHQASSINYELRACNERWRRNLRQLRQARERHRQAQKLHGLPPGQVLRGGLPEGPPQAAQEDLQTTRSGAPGRATLQSGTRETGGGILPDLRSADSVTKLGLQKDMRKAVELFTKAAELGSIEALFDLGNAYYNGDGVQEDKGKAAELYKKAAMQGHVVGRHNLGNHEGRKGNYDRAVRHYLISAKMGYEKSVQNIKRALMQGCATKEQYAEAMNGYQDAVEEMKSHDRDEAVRRLGY